MSTGSKRFGFWLAMLLLSGCGTLSTPTQEVSPNPSTQAIHPDGESPADSPVVEVSTEQAEQVAGPTASFPPELMFRLMAAELAAQQGDMALAASEYSRAALDTRDPKVIEQAMRYVSMGGGIDMEQLNELAELWVEVDTGSAPAHQALAMVKLQSGDSETAIAQLEYLLANFDTFDFNTIVTLLSRQPDHQQALEVIQQIVLQHADNAKAQFAHAHLAVRLGENEEALQATERALVLEPNWRDAINLRNRIFQMLAREDEAITLLQSSLDGELKDDVGLRNELARLLLRNNQVEAAWEQYRIILDQQPENESARYLYAVASLELGKTELGKAELQRLADGQQHSNDARFQLGRVAEREEDYASALNWYRSVNSGQYFIPSRLQEASILAFEGQLEEAIALLNQLESEDPNQLLNIVLVKGDILQRAQQLQRAHDEYSSAMQQLSDAIPLLYARSMVSSLMGQHQQAEEDLRTILTLDEDNVDALNALGYNLADRNVRLDEALGYLQRAMELKPNDGAITDSIGWLYFRMGNLQQAQLYLSQALEIMYDAEIAAHLGEVLWNQGEQQKAREVWLEAKEKNPDHPVLIETMQRLDP